jgi:Holliday junction DNA helicase RuvA
MIASLRGTLISKNPTEVVVDVGGVGYGVHIPLSTFEKLGNPGSEVSLHTYLHVREDAMLLYGFSSEEERSLFKLLLSVTGIGPRMAQGILSGIPVSDLRAYLQTGNTAALTTIPGIGRKLAERLVLELRDKTSKMASQGGFPLISSDAQGNVRNEALMALSSLGYNRVTAERAVRLAVEELGEKAGNLELLVKSALRNAGS